MWIIQDLWTVTESGVTSDTKSISVMINRKVCALVGCDDRLLVAVEPD